MATNEREAYLGQKLEPWHIRHGSVEFFSEYKGLSGETPISDMPANERP